MTAALCAAVTRSARGGFCGQEGHGDDFGEGWNVHVRWPLINVTTVGGFWYHDRSYLGVTLVDKS